MAAAGLSGLNFVIKKKEGRGATNVPRLLLSTLTRWYFPPAGRWQQKLKTQTQVQIQFLPTLPMASWQVYGLLVWYYYFFWGGGIAVRKLIIVYEAPFTLHWNHISKRNFSNIYRTFICCLYPQHWSGKHLRLPWYQHPPWAGCCGERHVLCGPGDGRSTREYKCLSHSLWTTKADRAIL